MGSLSTSIPTTALSLLVLFARASEAQDCYYPNGALSTSDAACSSDGDSACCPLNWDCLSNGLCYNPSQDFYGRYTCTDQTWQSSACPQFCAYAGAGDNSPAAGDQALLQDDDGDWCCDYNRDSSRPCTNQTDAVFFSLPAGTTVASISTLVPTTSAPSVSNAPLSTTQGTPVSTAGDSPSTSTTTTTTTTTNEPRPPSSTSPAASSRTTTSAQTSTIASSIVTTGRNGATTTIVTTEIQIAPPTPTPAPDDPAPSQPGADPSHPTPVGLIAGLATGVPALLLATAALLTYLYLKKRRRATPHHHHPDSHTDDDDLVKTYGTQVGSLPPDPRAPELDSYPVAVAATDGKTSELDASRPASGVSAVTPTTAAGLHSPVTSHLSPVSHLQVVDEEAREPAELWGGYVPYRPPPMGQRPRRSDEGGVGCGR